jgi:hypothetical protein
MTHQEARALAKRLADWLDDCGESREAFERCQRDAEALRLLLTPPTCATCQHWRERHTCGRGVTRPTTSDASFGCILHTPKAALDAE